MFRGRVIGVRVVTRGHHGGPNPRYRGALREGVGKGVGSQNGSVAAMAGRYPASFSKLCSATTQSVLSGHMTPLAWTRAGGNATETPQSLRFYGCNLRLQPEFSSSVAILIKRSSLLA